MLAFLSREAELSSRSGEINYSWLNGISTKNGVRLHTMFVFWRISSACEMSQTKYLRSCSRIFTFLKNKCHKISQIRDGNWVRSGRRHKYPPPIQKKDLGGTASLPKKNPGGGSGPPPSPQPKLFCRTKLIRLCTYIDNVLGRWKSGGGSFFVSPLMVK